MDFPEELDKQIEEFNNHLACKFKKLDKAILGLTALTITLAEMLIDNKIINEGVMNSKCKDRLRSILQEVEELKKTEQRMQ